MDLPPQVPTWWSLGPQQGQTTRRLGSALHPQGWHTEGSGNGSAHCLTLDIHLSRSPVVATAAPQILYFPAPVKQ